MLIGQMIPDQTRKGFAREKAAETGIRRECSQPAQETGIRRECSQPAQ
jgi:hypothetical protein